MMSRICGFLALSRRSCEYHNLALSPINACVSVFGARTLSLTYTREYRRTNKSVLNAALAGHCVSTRVATVSRVRRAFVQIATLSRRQQKKASVLAWKKPPPLLRGRNLQNSIPRATL